MPVGPFFLCDDPGIATPLKSFAANTDFVTLGPALVEHVVEHTFRRMDDNGAWRVFDGVWPAYYFSRGTIIGNNARQPLRAHVAAAEQTIEKGSAPAASGTLILSAPGRRRGST